MLNLTLQFFCSGFRLSSHTFESYCSKLFFFKEIEHIHFFKEKFGSEK